MRIKTSAIVLFTVSMVTLGIEVLLTRVFAVVLFASHSFLAISLTLLGSGAGAILAYLGDQTPEERQSRRQVLVLALMALAVLISFYVLLDTEFIPKVRQDPDTGEVRANLSFNKRSTMIMLHPELFNMTKLYSVVPLVFLPFLLAGYLQAFIFRHAPKDFAVYYGIDLLGATVGAIVIPLLLYPLGLAGTIAAIEVLILAPLALLITRRERSRWLLGAAALPLVLLVVCLLTGAFEIKHAAGFRETKTEREHWSPMARVALLKYKPGREMYVIDNASRTWYARQTPDDLRRYRDEMFNIAFEMKRGGSALIIASGGGMELVMADHLGVKDIDAVEIAGGIVKDIVEYKKDEPGNPYLLPSVNYHIADGRSVVKRSKKKYDVIEMKEVNFHSLGSQIAQAWSPYFIFTQEAFQEYMQHLKDDGLLCYIFFSRGDAPVVGDKGRRFRSVVAGMRLAGIDPERNFVMLARKYGYGYRSMVMAKPTPFTDEELLQILRSGRKRDKTLVMQYPDLRPLATKGLLTPAELASMQPTRQYIRDVARMVRKTRPSVSVWDNVRHPNTFKQQTNDDRPFLYGAGFRTAMGAGEKLIHDLYVTLLWIVGALTLLFIVLPLVVGRRGGERVRLDVRLPLILMGTGFGFMFVEMAAIYKYELYMHHPTIALMVILSSMILGAGLGSLHSHGIAAARKERSIVKYAAAAVATAAVLLMVVPAIGGQALLGLPLWALLAAAFVAFTVLGFFLGHVVPLSIGTFAAGQERLLAWCWAITVTASVAATVAASIISRDFGMFVVGVLGLACYGAVILTVLVGMALRRRPAEASGS